VIILLDQNVALDVLLSRHDHLESSEILSLARTGAIKAYLPAHGVTTIYYLLQKEFSDEEAREQLKQILQILKIALPTEDVFKKAFENHIADFEDAVVVESAVSIGADFIITRNEKDFRESGVPVHSAPNFMKFFAKN
jgi:predicted nucleic acid-binding protein